MEMVETVKEVVENCSSVVVQVTMKVVVEISPEVVATYSSLVAMQIGSMVCGGGGGGASHIPCKAFAVQNPGAWPSAPPTHGQ